MCGFFYRCLQNMKVIKSIVVLLVIFGLPLGSWYFLKYGYNWRKDKIEVLQPKGHFLNDIPWSEEEKTELYSSMFFKTNIVKVGNDVEASDELIIDQFRKAHTFQWLILLPEDQKAPRISTKDVKKYVNVESIFNQASDFSSAKYMIVDTAFQIRQVYNIGDEAELGQLVEDFSLSIPRKKDKDIAIRNK